MESRRFSAYDLVSAIQSIEIILNTRLENIFLGNAVNHLLNTGKVQNSKRGLPEREIASWQNNF